MSRSRPCRPALPCLIVALLLGGWSGLGAAEVSKLDLLLEQAKQHEADGRWDQACEAYDAILKLDRSLTSIKDKYQQCLRRYWQARRHRDYSFRKEVLSIDYGQALRLYGIMRDTLLDNSLEKAKADPSRLFAKGLEEFDAALADPYFCQQFLITARPEEIRAFRDFLKKNWGGETKLSRGAALKKLREVALAAQTNLNLNCTVTILEFTCGSCYALDDYTFYLTPNQLRELCDSLRGGLANIGLILRGDGDKFFVMDTARFSPAARDLNPGDEVVSIDKKSTRMMTLDEANDLMAGPQGTSIEVQVVTAGMGLRTFTFVRQTLFAPTVASSWIKDGVGYIHLSCFKDTTVQEMDEMLTNLLSRDMKALVLDLRGNDGGLFEAAIDVARRFLSSGVITSTENVDPKYNTVYEAKNPHALTLPIVVLVDGDTASAAEVLAGALKENRRARLVGQPTFGKSCTQVLVKLPSAPGGIPTGGLRLTVARFFSPDGAAYTGRGILPHILIGRPAMMSESMMGAGEEDAQLAAAVSEAHRLLGLR
ncbi:MAG: S41 family peptidase [Gemmataceae bacterium]